MIEEGYEALNYKKSKQRYPYVYFKFLKKCFDCFQIVKFTASWAYLMNWDKSCWAKSTRKSQKLRLNLAW